MISSAYNYIFKIPYNMKIYTPIFYWISDNINDGDWVLRFNSSATHIEFCFRSNENLTWVRYVFGDIELKS